MYTYKMFLSEDRIPYLKKGRRLPGTSCKSPDDIFQMMKNAFHSRELPEEHVWLLTMNTKLRVTAVFELSHGTVDVALVTPREVFMRALLTGSTSVAIVHNHPSLDEIPSKEDECIAKRLKKAGDTLGVSLIDFIIVGDNYFSFKEEGMI